MVTDLATRLTILRGVDRSNKSYDSTSPIEVLGERIHWLQRMDASREEKFLSVFLLGNLFGTERFEITIVSWEIV